MRLNLQWFLVMIVLMSLVACATTQEKWNKLTPNEKARIVIGDIQGQLNGAFDSAKLQIGYKPEWKTKVVPAFDVANKALADVGVDAMVQNQVSNVLNLCVQLGWIKK